MYLIISWHPTEAGKPEVMQTKHLGEMLKCAYLAGLQGYGVRVDEFQSDDTYGDECVTLYDSTVVPSEPGTVVPIPQRRKA